MPLWSCDSRMLGVLGGWQRGIVSVLVVVASGVAAAAIVLIILTYIQYQRRCFNFPPSFLLLFAGAGLDGVEEIKRHPFFGTIDWNVRNYTEKTIVLYDRHEAQKISFDLT